MSIATDQRHDTQTRPDETKFADAITPAPGNNSAPTPDGVPPELLRSVLDKVWGSWRYRAGIAAAPAVVYAVLAGLAMPRGPITTTQSLVSMGLGLAIGTFAGFVMRSRWAMLLAPVAFAVVFEVARLGTDGPTVDGPHFSTYGIIALVVGRVFHGLVGLAPMVLGVPLGGSIARRVAGESFWRRRGAAVVTQRTLISISAVLMLALAASVARPASTDAITDANGDRLPNSIAELATVGIGGHDLTMLIRGHDVANPVLLFLAGGPGGSEMGAMRNHLAGLEEHFTVVSWDQRGTGKSYRELDPTSTLTFDGAVSDTIEVTNYLRDRFDTEQIYLVGNSYGTLLGVSAAQQAPELYAAFVGTGQMVDVATTDRIFWEDTLAWAEERGKNGFADDLRRIGPPPYDNVLNYEIALSSEMQVYPYDHSVNSEGEGQMSENLFVEEYSLTEQVRIMGAVLDTFSVLYPQLQGIDFREDAASLDVPVFLVQGRNEAPGRAQLAEEWFEMLDAPLKRLIVLETSGHRPLFEQPDEFIDVMTNVVLTETGADK